MPGLGSSGMTIFKMAATNYEISSEKEIHSNSEVDLSSNEDENTIREAKRKGLNLKEPKKAAITRRDG